MENEKIKVEVGRLGNNLYIACFEHPMDLDKVLNKGPWNFEDSHVVNFLGPTL